MTQEKLEGLSLSLCLADILGGYVDEREVSRIFSSVAKPATSAAFEAVTDMYARNYWRRQGKEGKDLARRFLEAGKIEFDGLQDCSQGHWRLVSDVSALDVQARRRDREALSQGVSLDKAKMPVLRLKTGGR